MGIVTKIVEQKNNKEKVNIYIDHEFFAGVHKEVIYKFRIEEGVQVDKEKLELLIFDENLKRAKNKAFSILARTMHSEMLLRDKLSKEGYQDEIIDNVIEILKNYKMVDDEEYAKSYVRNKLSSNKYGKKRIIFELTKKKISEDIINKVISEIEDEKIYENAVYLAKKKLRSIKDKERNKIYQKLSQHLAYKGYDYEIIRKVVNAVMKDFSS
ncbi:regulatory protein RecX [Caloranaerobacter ferrireducens]|uniref:regulatory protein RecX n=1 Tax=Caloranaerobacter ferrireducens TaxID=1323370 RepID=UPI00084D55F1|nr:regulatory protein RecX [Caloranaerobacter ferrireducens]